MKVAHVAHGERDVKAVACAGYAVSNLLAARWDVLAQAKDFVPNRA